GEIVLTIWRNHTDDLGKSYCRFGEIILTILGNHTVDLGKSYCRFGEIILMILISRPEGPQNRTHSGLIFGRMGELNFSWIRLAPPGRNSIRRSRIFWNQTNSGTSPPRTRRQRRRRWR